MKFDIHPSAVSDLIPFSPSLSVPQSSDDVESMFAGISRNGLFMWVVSDATINIYHVETSEWFGGYCFQESLNTQLKSVKITAVVELCSSHITYPCLLIAVDDDEETLICLYNINISKVVRSILVPDNVLKMVVVSSNGGACMETHHLILQLRYFFGIVAIGTANGCVYFLDLCLDENFFCDEHAPNITLLVNKYEPVPERRQKSLLAKQHILMCLNDKTSQKFTQNFGNENFSVGPVTFGKIEVSALKYIQSAVTLAVGFNYGGIQLWDLTDLCLLYSVTNRTHELPIVSFAFQEPENDPRNFCYLWIVRGFSSSESPDDFSTATMYSLSFARRTFVESFGNLYTDMQSCSKRFEYPLTSDSITSGQSSSCIGSCILSCQTVNHTEESQCLDRPWANDSDSGPENTSLCFLSWLVWSSTNKVPSSHLAIFDLNQWYQAQMPNTIASSDSSHLNPYFAHYSLLDVIKKLDYHPILGLYAVPHFIKKFKFISSSEEFFYPSSLDFQMIAYSTTGICKANFIGLQRSLLYDIAEMGPNVLSNPKEFYSDLVQCGLVSDISNNSDRIPLIVQRETILELNLEYHMPFFFMKCFNEWRYADSIQEGCTSRALLNWAWKKVFHIKSSMDKLNLPLFNCAGSDVDKASLKCLYSYRRQLDLIDTILMGYQKYAPPRTEQGLQELKCRRDTVSAISMYLQVVLWLRSVHVLPEVCEEDETDKNILYPVNALVQSYARRRTYLHKIHSSIGPTDILLIDGLVKEAFSDNTWQEKGGNGIYPPPSIYATLSCYLLDEVPLDVKHSLMYYVLLDVCNSPHNANSPLIAEIEKFPSAFSMPLSFSKLVEAFWYLDQFNFQDAIKSLLHPAVRSSDILPWQHSRVIKSFLFQKEAQKALLYINHMDPPESTVEDMKLHLSVLLSRGIITEAFDYQRSKQSQGFGKELLLHLFLGCQETHRLKDIMYLPLNAFESSTLVQFLSDSEDPRSQEALVMYYLLRCNYFEASKVNEKLSMSLMGRSLSTHDRTAGRDALVDILMSSVPKTEKNLVDEVNRFQSIPIQKGDHLQPLSLTVKSAPLKQISYSDILSSLISGASSSMCAPYLEPKTPLKSQTRSFFDRIPFLRPPLTPDISKTMSPETKYNTSVSKRALVSPSSEYSSPNKKSRLLDSVSFRSGSLTKKKIPKHLANDVATLLQSPPIHRRGSQTSKSSIFRDSASAPHGILKKSVEPEKVSVALDKHTAKTPPLLSEDEDSVSEVFTSEKMEVECGTSEDVPGRQIRFSVPASRVLNTSVMSSSDTDSVYSSKVTSESFIQSNVPAELSKKSTNKAANESYESEAFKSKINVDSYESGDRMCLNVPRNKALFFLAREGIRSDAFDTEVLASESLRKSADSRTSSSSIPTHMSVTTESVRPHSVQSKKFIFDSQSEQAKSSVSSVSSIPTSSQKISFSFTKESGRSSLSQYETHSTDSQSESVPQSSSNLSSLAAMNEKSKSRSFFPEIISSDIYEAGPKSSASSSSVTSSQISSKEEKMTQMAEISEASSDCEIVDYIESVPKKNTVQDEPHTSAHEYSYEVSTSGLQASQFDPDSGWRPILSSDCTRLSSGSSDTSIYSSASERSFVTPRKPLRDASLNESASNLSGTSIAEEKEDVPITGLSSEVKQLEDVDTDICIIECVSSDDNDSRDVPDKHSIEKMDTEETVQKQSISEDAQIQNRNMPSFKQLIDHQIVRSLSQDYKAKDKNASSSAASTQIIEEFIKEPEQKIEGDIKEKDVVMAIEVNIQSNTEISETNKPVSISQMSNESSSSKSNNNDKNVVYNVVSAIPPSAYVPLSDRIKSSSVISDTDIPISKALSETSSSLKCKSAESKLDHTFRLGKSDLPRTPIKDRIKFSFMHELELKAPDNTHESSLSKDTKESKQNISNISATELKRLDTVTDISTTDIPTLQLNSQISSEENISTAKSKETEKDPNDSGIQSVESAKFDVFVPSTTVVKSRLPLKNRIKMSVENSGENLKSDITDSKSIVPEAHMSDIVLAKSSQPSDTDDKTSNALTLEETDKSSRKSSKLSVTGRDFSQKLSERFDFMSRHSDIYEQKGKLYAQSMDILQEEDMSDYLDREKPKSARKTRTFVFSTDKQETSVQIKKKPPNKTPKTKSLKSKTEEAKVQPVKDWKDFIESQDPESYEQFSQSIQQGILDVATLKNVDTNETASEDNDVSVFGDNYMTDAPSSSKNIQTNTYNKTKKTSTKEDTKSSKSTTKKAKAKTVTKMDFVFSEPHSPADPKIMEALSTPAEYEIGSYMFSPPLTRGRLRRKQNDDSMGSSFSSSMISEVSFTKSKKPPPIDPILEEIMAEQSTDPKVLTESAVKKKELPKKPPKSATKKSEQSATKKPKSATRKKRLDSSDKERSDSSPKLRQKPSPAKSTSSNSSKSGSPSHSMVLRQAKKRTDQLM